MMMIDHDDMRFSSFTRDLARRIRRPRSYPTPPPFLHDALEQLCGGLRVPPVVVSSPPSLSRWPEDLSEIDLLGEDEPPPSSDMS